MERLAESIGLFVRDAIIGPPVTSSMGGGSCAEDKAQREWTEKMADRFDALYQWAQRDAIELTRILDLAAAELRIRGRVIGSNGGGGFIVRKA